MQDKINTSMRRVTSTALMFRNQDKVRMYSNVSETIAMTSTSELLSTQSHHPYRTNRLAAMNLVGWSTESNQHPSLSSVAPSSIKVTDRRHGEVLDRETIIHCVNSIYSQMKLQYCNLNSVQVGKIRKYISLYNLTKLRSSRLLRRVPMDSWRLLHLRTPRGDSRALNENVL